MGVNSLGLRGQHGRIKVGYQTAATLGPFTLSPDSPGEWRVEAVVVAADEFWMAQEADRTLVLEVGGQQWMWRSVDLAVDGDRVKAILSGRPERR